MSSIDEITLVAGLLARSQYPEGPATGHLDTGFSWFPCVYKRMLRWFPRLQVATACFSCSPPDLNFLDPYFIFTYMHNNHCHQVTSHLQLNILLFGDRGGSVVKMLRYKSEGRWFDPSCCHWYLSLTYNPSDRTMALGSTRPLTEMSTKSISYG